MIHFPGEDQRSAEIQVSLREEFDLAERIYSFWCFHPKDSWLNQSRLPTTVTHTSMVLNVQACRQFRTVIEECKRAEGISAAILARSLFETMLALFFILKPIVRIGTNPIFEKDGAPKPDKVGKPKFAATPGSKKRKKPKPLSREFRAALYVGHVIFQDQRLARDCTTTAGRKRFGQMYERKLPVEVIRNTERILGPEWTSILRGDSGYSGLGIAGLAQLLHKRLDFWYRTVYHLQSRAVHSIDAIKASRGFDDGSMGATMFSEDDDIRAAVYSATGLFLWGLTVLQKYIGFGQDIERDLEAFATEYRRIYGTL